MSRHTSYSQQIALVVSVVVGLAACESDSPPRFIPSVIEIEGHYGLTAVTYRASDTVRVRGNVYLKSAAAGDRLLEGTFAMVPDSELFGVESGRVLDAQFNSDGKLTFQLGITASNGEFVFDKAGLFTGTITTHEFGETNVWHATLARHRELFEGSYTFRLDYRLGAGASIGLHRAILLLTDDDDIQRVRATGFLERFERDSAIEAVVRRIDSVEVNTIVGVEANRGFSLTLPLIGYSNVSCTGENLELDGATGNCVFNTTPSVEIGFALSRLGPTDDVTVWQHLRGDTVLSPWKPIQQEGTLHSVATPKRSLKAGVAMQLSLESFGGERLRANYPLPAFRWELFAGLANAYLSPTVTSMAGVFNIANFAPASWGSVVATYDGTVYSIGTGAQPRRIAQLEGLGIRLSGDGRRILLWQYGDSLLYAVLGPDSVEVLAVPTLLGTGGSPAELKYAAFGGNGTNDVWVIAEKPMGSGDGAPYWLAVDRASREWKQKRLTGFLPPRNTLRRSFIARADTIYNEVNVCADGNTSLDDCSREHRLTIVERFVADGQLFVDTLPVGIENLQIGGDSAIYGRMDGAIVALNQHLMIGDIIVSSPVLQDAWYLVDAHRDVIFSMDPGYIVRLKTSRNP